VCTLSHIVRVTKRAAAVSLSHVHVCVQCVACAVGGACTRVGRRCKRVCDGVCVLCDCVVWLGHHDVSTRRHRVAEDEQPRSALFDLRWLVSVVRAYCVGVSDDLCDTH
jgi:hypothetical protein